MGGGGIDFTVFYRIYIDSIVVDRHLEPFKTIGFDTYNGKLTYASDGYTFLTTGHLITSPGFYEITNQYSFSSNRFLCYVNGNLKINYTVTNSKYINLLKTRNDFSSFGQGYYKPNNMYGIIEYFVCDKELFDGSNYEVDWTKYNHDLYSKYQLMHHNNNMYR